MKQQVKDKFIEIFGDGSSVNVYFAPGRVNLIGEHTDYNGGHVFPCALTIGTYAACRKRSDMTVNFYSVNFEKDGIISANLQEEITPKDEYKWANYPLGIIKTFADRGMKLPCGFDMVVAGDIPNGSGLSSSASLEVMTGYALKDLYGFEVTNVDLALIGQYSENHFNGMNCGIMDQFASAMGKKDNAIFLDTATLEYEYSPIMLEGMKIVITNSCVKHSLVGSAYNDRRNSCEKALSELQKVVNINTLGELDEETFIKYESAIADDDRRKKAHHAVYENQRTIKAVDSLKKGNIILFGQLMNESHVSLRDDYDVSCEEIDVLVEAAWKVPGVIGSRITGGGFGGCTVSIVKDEAVDEFKKALSQAYEKAYGKVPEFYVVAIGDGPSKL